MDPNNPTVQLCVQGMRAEAMGRDSEARELYERAWSVATDDYDACVAAHYVARHQPTPERTLHWNAECLRLADAVGDDRVRGFYPSLHLSIAHSYLELGRQEPARHHLQQAAERIDDAPDGPYAESLRFGIAEALRTTDPPDPQGIDGLTRRLLERFCARADLKALALVLPSYVASLGTAEDRSRLSEALHLLRAERQLPAEEQAELEELLARMPTEQPAARPPAAHRPTTA